MSAAGSGLLARVLAQPPSAFALLYRPEAASRDELEVVVGQVSTPDTLAGIPLPPAGHTPGAEPRHDALVLIPYRQIAERRFSCVDDGTPLVALSVTEQGSLPLSDALRLLPDVPTRLSNGRFDVADDDYAATVREVIDLQIGTGEGANFVIKRTYRADIDGYTLASALAFFRRLVQRESGAYWTYLVHTGDRTLVGATPERHISVRDGTAVMNPISGTYRYPPSGPALPELLDFLADRKETDELYMVVDEELKMMARVCDNGGRVRGPYLKEMARLAHTEYLIEGRTGRDPRTVLRETMFAPTVTGSPLESAFRVIRRYEPEGRGYYGGVVALIGRDATGGDVLDSAIAIRTADIDHRGHLRIGVGATLVRHSDPVSEVAETRAKAAGLLAALEAGGAGRFGRHPQVRAALERRNHGIADFWLNDIGARTRPAPRLAGRRVLVIDAEDAFTSMMDHQMRALGMSVTVRRYDQPYDLDGPDLVVLGPGPGDPRADGHHKIDRLRAAARALLARRRPFLAVCLSHQVLCTQLGFALRRREIPNQGVQREIDLFGAPERVGFYNTFAAIGDADRVEIDGVGPVEVSRDARTGEVHALRGEFFATIQFHAESVLSVDGERILGDLMAGVLAAAERVGTAA
ncbi:anthranilate synthase family protein [Rhizomonospora bruguierae]|uniref:anthranilate synthase family protein n=1 Tax=Rhizomonospora bruguierae TaxID=1581705 RepID=UPI001BCAECD2|nr:anthranilate synthase family protein [Micromonospora sp. NBRC 107566]